MRDTVAVLVAVALALAGCEAGHSGPVGAERSPPPAAATSGPPEADLWTVRAMPFRAALVVDGSLRHAAEAPVAVDASGLTVAPGTNVARGEVIGRTGPTERDLVEARRAVEDAELQREIAHAARPVDRFARRAAEVQLDRAVADLFALERAVTAVASPVKGSVLVRPSGDVVVRPGDLVAVAELTPLQALRVAAGHEEAMVSVRLLEGEVTVPCGDVAVDGRPPAPADGDDAAPSLELRCAVPARAAVLPGLPVRISVVIADLDEALTVPATALGLAGIGVPAQVVVRAGEREEVRTVEVGPSNGIQTVVESGLEPGETVLRYWPHAGGQEP